MILVSFSLYVTNPKYDSGALKNAEYIKTLGPEWRSIFFLGEEVSKDLEIKLSRLGAIVNRREKSWHENGMFWRFTAITDYDYEYLLIRDVDSRISHRELSAVRKWFLSGKILHIMRDHPYHNALILGGLWGVTADVKSVNIPWEKTSKYGVTHGQDQVFLKREVYPLLKHSMHITDSFFSFPLKRNQFSTPREECSYVGESIDQHGQFDKNLRLTLRAYEESALKKLRIRIIFLLHKLFNF
jgi:hypothetical protein